MASNLPSTIDLTQSLHMASTDEGTGHARSARRSSDDRNIENTITVHVQDKCLAGMLAGGPALILRVVRGATGLDDLGSKPLTPRRKGLRELYRCLTWRDLRVGRRKKL